MELKFKYLRLDKGEKMNVSLKLDNLFSERIKVSKLIKSKNELDSIKEIELFSKFKYSNCVISIRLEKRIVFKLLEFNFNSFNLQ